MSGLDDQVWDADTIQVIHLEPAEDGLTLILPNGEPFVLSPYGVRKLRLALQRHEAAAKRTAGP